jgi:hypothetical protein
MTLNKKQKISLWVGIIVFAWWGFYCSSEIERVRGSSSISEFIPAALGIIAITVGLIYSLKSNP